MIMFFRHSDQVANHPFATFQSCYSISGQKIGRSPLSQLLLVEHSGHKYYVKKYHRPGKYLRRFLGRSRCRAEWENLLLFQKLGLHTPNVIAYGECRLGPWYLGGVLVTEAIDQAVDLVAASKTEIFNDSQRIGELSASVAAIARVLHQHRFVHNDLKWRNILLDKHNQIYLIDCPQGRCKRGYALRRGIVKDIACLDKVAKKCLSRSQRLRFIKEYLGVKRLDAPSKRFISQVVSFFK